MTALRWRLIDRLFVLMLMLTLAACASTAPPNAGAEPTASKVKKEEMVEHP